ncbi:MAG: Flp family type IVb pilin [Methylocystis sp.]|nr:Flp family type IVb pilin [Methylocystis sp.]MCA3583956.1 Flp family type IVb pilin [Methylocystis sp.]MCA3589566.1 Flp family type IVb pilin [Methylocystis sp.]MCA3592460.1 Flp family type IVb pilin [Methylocystis sp.]
MRLVKKSLADQSGATAIEYGLFAGLLSFGIVVSLTNIKDSWVGMANNIVNVLAK